MLIGLFFSFLHVSNFPNKKSKGNTSPLSVSALQSARTHVYMSSDHMCPHACSSEQAGVKRALSQSWQNQLLEQICSVLICTSLSKSVFSALK